MPPASLVSLLPTSYSSSLHQVQAASYTPNMVSGRCFVSRQWTSGDIVHRPETVCVGSWIVQLSWLHREGVKPSGRQREGV